MLIRFTEMLFFLIYSLYWIGVECGWLDFGSKSGSWAQPNFVGKSGENK